MDRSTSAALAASLLLSLASCDDGREPLRPDAGIRPDAGTDAAVPVDAPVADNWDNYARGFFATYCVECHDGGARDFRRLESVRANMTRTRCGVSAVELDGCGTGTPPPRQFPVGTGPRPSDEERARLVRWLDAGAP